MRWRRRVRASSAFAHRRLEAFGVVRACTRASLQHDRRDPTNYRAFLREAWSVLTGGTRRQCAGIGCYTAKGGRGDGTPPCVVPPLFEGPHEGYGRTTRAGGARLRFHRAAPPRPVAGRPSGCVPVDAP